MEIPKVVVTEKVVAERVKRIARTLGCKVVSFQQPRRTMQTPGIPDLKIYYLPSGQTFWFEVKSDKKGAKQSDAQKGFQQMAEDCGEHYFIGGTLEPTRYSALGPRLWPASCSKVLNSKASGSGSIRSAVHITEDMRSR